MIPWIPLIPLYICSLHNRKVQGIAEAKIRKEVVVKGMLKRILTRLTRAPEGWELLSNSRNEAMKELLHRFAKLESCQTRKEREQNGEHK